MVEGSFMSCVKYIILAFNFLFGICSLVLVVIGIFAKANGVTLFTDTDYASMTTIIIATGCVVFFVAFFGCCGAMRENGWKLIVYAILLVIIFMSQVVLIILAYMHRAKTDAFVKDSMKHSLSQQKNDTLKVWDSMQSAWECCGVESAKDYSAEGMSIPDSCCKSGTSGECTEGQAFSKGCYNALIEFIRSNLNLLYGVGGVLAIVEIVGAVFAFCLASDVNSEKKARAPLQNY